MPIQPEFSIKKTKHGYKFTSSEWTVECRDWKQAKSEARRYAYLYDESMLFEVAIHHFETRMIPQKLVSQLWKF